MTCEETYKADVQLASVPEPQRMYCNEKQEFDQVIIVKLNCDDT